MPVDKTSVKPDVHFEEELLARAAEGKKCSVDVVGAMRDSMEILEQFVMLLEQSSTSQMMAVFKMPCAVDPNVIPTDYKAMEGFVPLETVQSLRVDLRQLATGADSFFLAAFNSVPIRFFDSGESRLWIPCLQMFAFEVETRTEVRRKEDILEYGRALQCLYEKLERFHSKFFKKEIGQAMVVLTVLLRWKNEKISEISAIRVLIYILKFTSIAEKKREDFTRMCVTDNPHDITHLCSTVDDGLMRDCPEPVFKMRLLEHGWNHTAEAPKNENGNNSEECLSSDEDHPVSDQEDEDEIDEDMEEGSDSSAE